MMTKIGRIALLCATTTLFATAAQAQDAWYPTEVKVWDNPLEVGGDSKDVEYVPLEKSSKKWNICVSLPHVKDAYFLALVYGLEQQAKDLGVSLQVVEAGGYTQLSKQISQIENCVSGGADAVAVVAISTDGLNNIASEVTSKGTPFLTFSNDTTSDVVSAQTQVSYTEMGTKLAEYLISTASNAAKPTRIAWLPGPAGASWVEEYNLAFREALEGSSIVMGDTKYGDTGKEVQLRLIEDAVQADPDLEYIVGNAVAAEAAIGFLRSRGLQDKIKVVSSYLTPDVYEAVKRGDIAMAMSDSTVLVSRIVIDQAVRILEEKDVFRNISTKVVILDSNSVNQVDETVMLAPAGYRPVFNVN